MRIVNATCVVFAAERVRTGLYGQGVSPHGKPPVSVCEFYIDDYNCELIC